jgi:hypothetical protein
MREASLVAATVLPDTRCALGERRHVGTAASYLSALAGARGGGGRRHPANAKTKRLNSCLSRTVRLEERLPTSGWRSPASSSSRARRALWPRPTSPPSHSQTPPRRTPAPSRRVPPLPWTAWRQALPRPPQTLAPLPPPRLSVRGRGLPALGGSLPPVALFLLLSRRRVLRGCWGRKSLLLSQPELLILLLSALPPPDPILFLARRQLLLLLPPLRRARGLGLGAWADRTARHPRSPSAGDK